MGACTAAAVKIRKHAHDCPIHSRTVPSMLALTKYNAVEPPPLAGCCTEHVTKCTVQAYLQKGAQGVITNMPYPTGAAINDPCRMRRRCIRRQSRNAHDIVLVPAQCPPTHQRLHILKGLRE